MRAAIYARFSSDNQREESIDAQIRAAKYYADQYGYEIVKIYADKAKSGRSTDRPEFMRMIQESSDGLFQAVLVHKLDRFSRDSTDSLYYERLLNRNGVELISVNEKLDKSPEGALMKMVITGMNEFYSKNLAREVMKGLKENAYNCKHTGGLTPLGYDLDSEKNYILNDREAASVKLIYEMYAAGHSYGEILYALKRNEFKTKIGREFGKNSLYEILKNEKYTGVFIFNKSASKSIKGTFNRHKYKNEKDIIRIEDGIPAIIEKSLFQEVQNRMEQKKKSRASHKAKYSYMLSGLVICAECGGSMTGETRRYRNKEYSYYVCNNQKRNNSCSCKPINKDKLEQSVIQNISGKIFNRRNVHSICKRIHESYRRSGIETEMLGYEKEIRSLNTKISNLYRAIENGLNAEETTKRINLLTKQKNVLEFKLIELNSIPEPQNKSVEELVDEFSSRAHLQNLSKDGQKKIIQQIVEKIFLYDSEKIRLVINPNGPKADFWDTNGGEGGI